MRPSSSASRRSSQLAWTNWGVCSARWGCPWRILPDRRGSNTTKKRIRVSFFPENRKWGRGGGTCLPATHESVFLVFLRFAELFEGRFDLFVVLLGGVVQRICEPPNRLDANCGTKEWSPVKICSRTSQPLTWPITYLRSPPLSGPATFGPTSPGSRSLPPCTTSSFCYYFDCAWAYFN